ncbi:acyltransferase [Bacteroides graminisolvens]|uniref:acyltransferase n=1 Tax=Bacteroides graminisolvens TaxID=477666 RepID=UPI00240A0EE4|nr:acyltransferase [Bacteroides graminisolvens]
MRVFLSYSYRFIFYFFFVLNNAFCKLLLLINLWLLNIPHGKIYTGGGLVKISLSRKGKIIIGDNVNFANSWEIGYPFRCFLRVRGNGILKIGNNTGLNSVSIFCDQSVLIGNNVSIGGGTKIFDTNFHNMNYIERRNLILNANSKTAAVVIEDDVFVGGCSLIGKGVTIGARSIIAAGSVVVKSVPSDQLWGGNPAQFIKVIN